MRAFAYYFGLSDAADAFNAAFRIPNLLQNLLGEGVLSACFIPVYASLLSEQKQHEARNVAYTIGAILLTITSALVAGGVLATPILIAVIAPGFTGAKRQLTIHLVRILFGGSGLLVLSAWCLGILNSHRRFFLSYAAPVIWNAAMIGTLLWKGRSQSGESLVTSLAWGSVLGSALQAAVQLPSVLNFLRGMEVPLAFSGAVRQVLRNFVPAFISRGVVQISAYVDSILASLLPTGAVAALANAQLLYTLPVSLFGMSISAAELPLMSSASGTTSEVTTYLKSRLSAGLRRIAFFVVPCSVMFLTLGDVIAAALLQTGRFTRSDAVYVWAILAGSAIGLLASTMGRLYTSTFYALRDTRTPLRFATLRVLLTTALGYLFAFPLPRWLGLDPRWGAAGLTASAGLAGWVECALLRRSLRKRIGKADVPGSLIGRLWTSALLAATASLLANHVTPVMHPVLEAVVTLACFGAVYLVLSRLQRIEIHIPFLGSK